MICVRALSLLLLTAILLPAAETNLSRRLGFYQWTGVAPPDGQDLLTQAHGRAVQAGAAVFRLYLGARFDYLHPALSSRSFSLDGIDPPLTPAKILAIPRFRAVLEDPAIDTVVLTVYPIHDYGSGPDDLNLLRPWTSREQNIEHRQITQLCRYLYREFGDHGKTVILANSEADEKMLEILNYTGSPETAVENLRRWTQTRFEAVQAAREAHPQARLRILHALEISLVHLQIVSSERAYRKAAPRGRDLAGGGWNALAYVVPYVAFLFGL